MKKGIVCKKGFDSKFDFYNRGGTELRLFKKSGRIANEETESTNTIELKP